MKRFTYYMLLLIVLAPVSCKKDISVSPQVNSLSISIPKLTTAKFSGNLLHISGDNIVDHGFMYSYSEIMSAGDYTKFSLGKPVREGEFEATVENLSATSDMRGSPRLYVRAYIYNGREYTYGKVLSAALPNPAIHTIVPHQGSAGDTVTFRGKFYQPNIESSMVIFDRNVTAKIVAATDTTLSVVVPAKVPGSHGRAVKVVTYLNGVYSEYDVDFVMLAKFRDFMPKKGPVGTRLEFIGDNLPDSYCCNLGFHYTVGQHAMPNNWDYRIPYDTQLSSAISVNMGGRKVLFDEPFEITPPEFISFSAQQVFPGQMMFAEIKNVADGSDIGGDTKRPAIKIGPANYLALSHFGGHAWFEVPSLPEGEYPVSIVIGPHKIEPKEKLRIAGYAATSFAPQHGSVGTQVEIKGLFKLSEQYEIYFGSERTYAYATDSNTILVNVPHAAAIGEVNIVVQTAAKKLTLPGKFNVSGPVFHSFSPKSGVPGDRVIIQGSGFGTTTWGIAAGFGSVDVTPIRVTDKLIEVVVPSDVRPGSMKLSVTRNGQRVQHDDTFTLGN